MGFNCAFPLSSNKLKAHYTLALRLLRTALAPQKLSDGQSFLRRARKAKWARTKEAAVGARGVSREKREMVPHLISPLVCASGVC